MTWLAPNAMEGLGTLTVTLLVGEVVVLVTSWIVGLTLAFRQLADVGGGILVGGILPAAVAYYVLFLS